MEPITTLFANFFVHPKLPKCVKLAPLLVRFVGSGRIVCTSTFKVNFVSELPGRFRYKGKASGNDKGHRDDR